MGDNYNTYIINQDSGNNSKYHSRIRRREDREGNYTIFNGNNGCRPPRHHRHLDNNCGSCHTRVQRPLYPLPHNRHHGYDEPRYYSPDVVIVEPEYDLDTYSFKPGHKRKLPKVLSDIHNGLYVLDEVIDFMERHKVPEKPEKKDKK